MGPLYQQIMGMMMPSNAPTNMKPVQQAPVITNPVQLMQYAMQAMRNPAEFVKQHIKDIPADIQNDPNQILLYLQRTRGLTNQDIQHALSMPGQIQGQGVVR